MNAVEKNLKQEIEQYNLIGIYGFGKYGLEIQMELVEIGVDNFIFVCTDQKLKTKNMVRGTLVMTLDEMKSKSANYIVIISEKSKYHFQMKLECERKKIKYILISRNYFWTRDIPFFNGIKEIDKLADADQVPEQLFYQEIRRYIKKIETMSKYLQPSKREECFDRLYINDYVKREKEYIKGDVLEFAGGEVVYAKKYGKDAKVYLMAGSMHRDIYSNVDFYADLDDETSLPDMKFDCIVATQVIMYMKNVETALYNLKRMLKVGGALILTVPGPLFHHSKNSHHMYSFTEESLKYLCSKVFGNCKDFEYYGNIYDVVNMLFWMKYNQEVGIGEKIYLYTLVMGITVLNEN